MTVAQTERTFIPAAGRHWRLPFYDPLTKLIGVDRLRRSLLDQADLRSGHQVLDVGCGTGTLPILIKRAHPDIEVIGLDPDANALTRAKRKAARAGVSVQFDEGFSDAMRYPDGTFDRVFSSFMFHHLQRDEKIDMLHEVRRVLKPGGRLELLDFAGPEFASGGRIARRLHAHALMQDNAATRVLGLCRQAGLLDARPVGHRSFLLGHVAYYEASRPKDAM